MKWYWIVLIIVAGLIVGYLISLSLKKKQPMNKNGIMLTDNLKSELIAIDQFLQGRPNPSDPEYQDKFERNTKRKAEILDILKGVYQCSDISYIYNESLTGVSINCIK